MTPWELAVRLALAIVVTLVATRVMARAVRHIWQPPVVGEIIAGLLLGPSVLGALPGDPSNFIFPSQVIGVLTTVAQIGVVLYLLLVGLDVGTPGIAKSRRSLLTISLSSLLVPFALGALLATQLYETHAVVGSKAVDPLAFTLFMGTAFAMTAFPVLVRILTDSGMHRDPLGRLAIGCAAILDALGWILLAVALAVASSGSVSSLVSIVVEGAAFVAVLVLVVRPLLGRLVARHGTSRPAPPSFVALIVVLTFASAAITDAIGLHALVGPVLVGAVYPRRRNPASAPALDATLRPVTVSVILPFFFLLPGLTIDLRDLGGPGIAELGLILLVACTGKFIGAAAASRVCGYAWREAAVLGTLMNTRGMVELVILSVGVSVHVLDTELYGLMVIMALTTTMMTGPLLHLLCGQRFRAAADDRQRPVATAARSPSACSEQTLGELGGRHEYGAPKRSS